ncbi:MAG: hypothetical protein HFACDABA_03143 [Anaerolineales bacterium]|nr:hypothetical protein [Anaerolineales bacterium]
MKKIILLSVLWIVLPGILLLACSGGASTNVVGEWELVSYGPPSNPSPAAPGVDTSITFGTDGQVNGNVGCNLFGGGYEISGTQITFAPLRSTRMACMDAVGEQENAILAAFAETANFSLDGDLLTIVSADGSSLVTLARK